jgi:hypothetical protein
MNPREVSAQFAAYVWFQGRDAATPAAEAAARGFAQRHWAAFLPCAQEGLGRLLIRVAGARAEGRGATPRPGPAAWPGGGVCGRMMAEAGAGGHAYRVASSGAGRERQLSEGQQCRRLRRPMLAIQGGGFAPGAPRGVGIAGGRSCRSSGKSPPF